MHKTLIIGLFAVSLLGSFCMSNAMAEGAATSPEVEVAAIEPGTTTPKVTAKTLPGFLDEDLANQRDIFSRFAQKHVVKINRNHRLSRSRMQVTREADGTFRGRYHAIDQSSLATKVRRSSSESIPFVGVLSYHETVYEAVAESREALNDAAFNPVLIIPNRHIFSYRNDTWQ